MASAQEPVATKNENGIQYDVDFGDAVISVPTDDASNKKDAIAEAKKIYDKAPKAVDPAEGQNNE